MKTKIKNIGLIIIGNLLLAFGLSTLVISNNIISGGVTGIGIVFNHLSGLPIASVVAIINVILFIIGFIFVGKEFVLKTLLSSILFPVFLNFFQSATYLHNFCDDLFLSSILAGCFVGIGVALVIKAGASSGGLDVICIILKDKFNIPVFITLNLFDLTVLGSQVPFSDTNKIIYGIVVVMVTSMVLDKTLMSGKKMMQVYIISEEYEVIRQSILNELDLGATLLKSENGYSKIESKVVLSVIPASKLESLKQSILTIDPHAFITVSLVSEVSGKGFTLERV